MTSDDIKAELAEINAFARSAGCPTNKVYKRFCFNCGMPFLTNFETINWCGFCPGGDKRLQRGGKVVQQSKKRN